MKNVISQEDIQKAVIIKNGKDVVRSDILAKIFGKQHKDILRVIRNKTKSLNEAGINGQNCANIL